MKCYLTGNDEAVVGLYKSVSTLSNRSTGMLIGMKCSVQKNPTDCEFYKRCLQRLKHIETE